MDLSISEALLSPFSLAVLGLCIGSFLNVVIHRLPMMLEKGWRQESADLLGVKLEEEGIDTIGGLIFNRLGDLPRAGTKLRLDEIEFTVRRVSRKRIEEVLIVPDREDEAPEE